MGLFFIGEIIMQYYIIQHSSEGSQASNHKYISRKMGRNGKWEYVYDGDTNRTKRMRNKYANMEDRLRILRRRQRRLERRIDDDSLSNSKKTKRTLHTGDKLDRTLDKIERITSKMQRYEDKYQKLRNKNIRSEIRPTDKGVKPQTKEEWLNKQKELRNRLTVIQKRSSEYKTKLQENEKKASSYYSKSDEYKKKGKNKAYEVTGIVGKKYESIASRYGAKTEYADMKISKIEERLVRIGKILAKKYGKH